MHSCTPSRLWPAMVIQCISILPDPQQYFQKCNHCPHLWELQHSPYLIPWWNRCKWCASTTFCHRSISKPGGCPRWLATGCSWAVRRFGFRACKGWKNRAWHVSKIFDIKEHKLWRWFSRETSENVASVEPVTVERTGRRGRPQKDWWLPLLSYN